MPLKPMPDPSRSKPEPESLRLALPGAILYGVKCPECGGHLAVPLAGPTPTTCSAKCRQRAHRRKKRIEKGGSGEPRPYAKKPRDGRAD